MQLRFMLAAVVCGRLLVGQTGATNPPARDIYCVATSGSATAYSCTPTVAISAYVAGKTYRFQSDITNTGSATVNLGPGAKTITKPTGGSTTPLIAGDIQINQQVVLIYDGTEMQMVSLLGNAGVPSSSAVTAGALTPTVYTVGTLPGSPASNQVVHISDGVSISDCTTGGGTIKHSCQWNGSAWVFYSTGHYVWSASISTTVAASTTTYLRFPGTLITTQGSGLQMLGDACQISNLYTHTSAGQPASGSLVVTFQSGPAAGPPTTAGTDTSVVATIPLSGAAGIYSDTTHTATLLPTDGFYIKFTNNATATSASMATVSFACSY